MSDGDSKIVEGKAAWRAKRASIQAQRDTKPPAEWCSIRESDDTTTETPYEGFDSNLIRIDRDEPLRSD